MRQGPRLGRRGRDPDCQESGLMSAHVAEQLPLLSLDESRLSSSSPSCWPHVGWRICATRQGAFLRSSPAAVLTPVMPRPAVTHHDHTLSLHHLFSGRVPCRARDPSSDDRPHTNYLASFLGCSSANLPSCTRLRRRGWWFAFDHLDSLSPIPLINKQPCCLGAI